MFRLLLTNRKFSLKLGDIKTCDITESSVTNRKKNVFILPTAVLF